MWLIIDWQKVGLDAPRVVARFTAVHEVPWNDERVWNKDGRAAWETTPPGTIVARVASKALADRRVRALCAKHGSIQPGRPIIRLMQKAAA
jgi:hypothetical protein